MVLAFGAGTNLLGDWTNDSSALDGAIRRAEIGAGDILPKGKPRPPGFSGTKLYDSVYLTCQIKMTHETGHKALVILTDADDNNSAKTIAEAIEAAQRADTLVEMLMVYDPFSGSDYSVAKRLAEETGGRAIDLYDQKSLQGAFDEISDQLRTEYTLGYYPTNTREDGTFRRIKVELSNKDYKTLVRKGYYAKGGGN